MKYISSLNFDEWRNHTVVFNHDESKKLVNVIQKLINLVTHFSHD